MTPADIAAARALCEAATPGPWEVDRFNRKKWVRIPDASDDQVIANRDNDAAFVAAARTLVPALIDEVERLSREVDEYKQHVRDAYGDRDDARAEVEAMRSVVDAATAWKDVADDPGAPVWKWTERLDAAIDRYRSVALQKADTLLSAREKAGEK